MINKIIIFILMIFSNLIFASQAVVIVLETPLFAEKSLKSTIVQYVRKGDQIFIYSNELSKSPNQLNFLSNDNKLKNYAIETIDAPKGFYTTLDKNGQRRFIQAKHVKIIYRDERDQLSSITPFEFDPMDYRLEEPLSDRHPFYLIDQYRGSLSFTLGPQTKNHYLYKNLFQKEKYNLNKGLKLYYLKQINFVPSARFFFGANFDLALSKANFKLNPGHHATEDLMIFSLGPEISYDIFRHRPFILSLLGGINLNYIQKDILITSGSLQEERKFSRFSFSPHLSTILQIETWIKTTTFIIGSEFRLFTSNNLINEDIPNEKSLWNENNDFVPGPVSTNFMLYIGIQANYL